MASQQSAFPYGLNSRLVLTGVAIFATGFIARGLLTRPDSTKIVRSPRDTLLPELSSVERSKLPYPPDSLPGARDVDSPYGTIRVYEWGPEDGRKVLLIHGVSTPCLALGAVAHGLADAGCRVMLFDLFGRGYSDAPTGLPFDVRLFTTQILITLASSSLSWTGKNSGGFSLVGYSLGGGIAANFTANFPGLVTSLVLIAPSGVIRPHHFSRLNRVIYSQGLLPEPLLNSIVRRRLQTPLAPTKQRDQKPDEEGILAPVKAEINLEGNPGTVLSKSHPDITIESAVGHQVLNHQGFVPAFMSSIRNGPISFQHDDWRRIGHRLSTQQQGSTEERTLAKGKVFIVSGSKDAIINETELRADATDVFEGHVDFKFIDAGHELPVAKGDVVAKEILSFWA